MELRLPAFRSIHDISLFVRCGFTDARLRRMRSEGSASQAFDQLYSEAPNNDPWIADSSRSLYQQRKYDALLAMLPRRRFRRALDLGCGSGLLTQKLAGLAEHVVGADVSSVALDCAADRAGGLANVSWRQADAADLDLGDETFDLIVVADTIYYFDAPISDATIKRLAWRLSRLLSEGGILLLVNHYFFVSNADTRLTRRIHDAFAWSPLFDRVAEHRRVFYLATLLQRREQA